MLAYIDNNIYGWYYQKEDNLIGDGTDEYIKPKLKEILHNNKE